MRRTFAYPAGPAVAAAEAARDAALAAGNIYADTTAGVAATAEGDYFTVPSAESDESFVLYRVVAGAAVEQKRYPIPIETLPWIGLADGSTVGVSAAGHARFRLNGTTLEVSIDGGAYREIAMAETWNAGRSVSTTSIAAATEKTVVSTTTETVVESLEFSTNTTDQVYLRILPKDGGTGTPIGVIAKDGDATVLTVAPVNVLTHGHPLVEVVEYDTSTSSYKLRFRSGVTFAEGVDIILKNANGSTAYNCAYSAIWRYK